MRIYYKTPFALVTDEVIQVDGRPTRRIASLDSLYVVEVRQAPDPQWTDRRSGQAVVTTLTSLVVAVHDVMSGGGTPLLVPATAFAVGALAVIAGSRSAVGRNGGTVGELWALTCTGPVCLFRSRNRETIAQIRHAVADARAGRRR